LLRSGNRQSFIKSSVTTILFHFDLVLSAIIIVRLWRHTSEGMNKIYERMKLFTAWPGMKQEV